MAAYEWLLALCAGQHLQGYALLSSLVWDGNVVGSGFGLAEICELIHEFARVIAGVVYASLREFLALRYVIGLNFNGVPYLRIYI